MSVECGFIKCNSNYKTLEEAFNHIKSTHPEFVKYIESRRLSFDNYIDFLKVKGVSNMTKVAEILKDLSEGKIHKKYIPQEYDNLNKYVYGNSKNSTKGGNKQKYYWCPSLNTTGWNPDLTCDVKVEYINPNKKGGMLKNIRNLLKKQKQKQGPKIGLTNKEQREIMDDIRMKNIGNTHKSFEQSVEEHNELVKDNNTGIERKYLYGGKKKRRKSKRRKSKRRKSKKRKTKKRKRRKRRKRTRR